MTHGDHPNLTLGTPCLGSWKQLQDLLDELDELIEAGHPPNLLLVGEEVDEDWLAEIADGMRPGETATVLIGFADDDDDDDDPVAPEPLPIDDVAVHARTVARALDDVAAERGWTFQLSVVYHRAPGSDEDDDEGLAVGVITIVRLTHLRVVA